MPITTVEEIYCFVHVDENGREAILQTQVGSGLTTQRIPLLTASTEMLGQLRKIAQEHANKSHTKVLCLRLNNREVVEEFEEQLVKPA